MSRGLTNSPERISLMGKLIQTLLITGGLVKVYLANWSTGPGHEQCPDRRGKLIWDSDR